jgi:hypothetical protein
MAAKRNVRCEAGSRFDGENVKFCMEIGNEHTCLKMLREQFYASYGLQTQCKCRREVTAENFNAPVFEI